MKHDFYMDGDRIDSWRLDIEYHNGPKCRRCYEIKCEHCHPEFLDEECPSNQLELF